MSKSNKHFKRRLSFFLVFVLAFGSVVSVSAEELSQRNYSAKEDISYENYRLADLPEVIANSILTTDTTPRRNNKSRHRRYLQYYRKKQ